MRKTLYTLSQLISVLLLRSSISNYYTLSILPLDLLILNLIGLLLNIEILSLTGFEIWKNPFCTKFSLLFVLSLLPLILSSGLVPKIASKYIRIYIISLVPAPPQKLLIPTNKLSKE